VKAAGLTAGVVAFLGVATAPLWAPLPAPLRWAATGLLVLAAVASLLLRRRPAPAAAAYALAVTVALAPDLAAMPGPARLTLAATVWIAAWWISGAIPLGATSLLPLVLFPTLGVLPMARTAASYADQNVFLFLGGFIIALGIQRWGLHRRIALHIIHAVGSSPPRVVLGFMVASAFLSMWISNTATALMMLPIALAVISAMEDGAAGGRQRAFAVSLLLGVAYAASIGGLATPIGTPPNISFLRILEILYPSAPTISFAGWLVAFGPLVAIFLPLAWLVLTRVAFPLRDLAPVAARATLREELRSLGRMAPAERRMLWVFVATASLWITRADLDLGSWRLTGWAGWIERLAGPPFEAATIHDATVAIAMAILTFLLPAGRDDRGNPRALMDWSTARRLPWDILLLFGGGFALAAAYEASGLSAHLATAFATQVHGAPPLLLVAASCLLLTLLTEVTSNTATTQVLLPVLAGVAAAMEVHPLLVMLPATLSASCAFMLPIATPPNAIVFGSGRLGMTDMVRAGLWLNLLGVVLITAVFLLWSAPILGLDLSVVPAWAQPGSPALP
jgi:sodium-dependent dicarboxylate transporter 2/3/5